MLNLLLKCTYKVKQNALNLNLETCAVVAVVGVASRCDVWSAHELIATHRCGIDELWCWNDLLAVVAGESVVAIVIAAAPSCSACFRLLWSPDFTRVVSDAVSLMWSAWSPSIRADDSWTKASFDRQIRVSFRWSVAAVAVIAAAWSASEIWWRSIRVSVLGYWAAWINSAGWSIGRAWVTWWIQVTRLVIQVATAFERFAFSISVVAFRQQVVKTFFDVRSATVSLKCCASAD